MTRQLIDINNGPNIQKEKEIIKEMIELYCRKKHQRGKLCKECRDLKNYALLRVSLCHLGEEKTTCSNCTIHCYKPKFRKKMEVLKHFARPWMMLYHPAYSWKQWVDR
jgi:hypothetical protein